jgi:hypothetical protein
MVVRGGALKVIEGVDFTGIIVEGVAVLVEWWLVQKKQLQEVEDYPL